MRVCEKRGEPLGSSSKIISAMINENGKKIIKTKIEMRISRVRLIPSFFFVLIRFLFMDLSVIIVNYNTYTYTKNCILSVLESIEDGGLNAEIIVVDNASQDGSIEKLYAKFRENENVKFIRNKENIGFSGANNIGMKAARGDFFLLLNSDTLVQKDTLKNALTYLKSHPQYKMLGCKIELEDGSLDKACKRSFPTPMGALYHFLKLDELFPNSKTFGSYNLTYLNEDRIQPIECISGAFMLFPREIYEELGGLSEDYFMYCEDNDFCYRLKENGHQIVYYPETKITHFKKKSWNAKKNPQVLDAFYDSMLIFYDKFYTTKYNRLTRNLVKSGVTFFKKMDHLKNFFTKSN